MVYSSLTFLFGFLSILLILYFLMPNIKLKNIVLLIFSIVFYAWGEPKCILLMILITIITYISGLAIAFCIKKEKTRLKKITFVLSIMIILLNLIIFKYANFLVENINNIFDSNMQMLNLVMPIGISFYTFQILSYLIDLYRGKIAVQKNFLLLWLYISLFPQLIAGPIVRYEDIYKELTLRHSSFDDIVDGSKRFIIGLAKKVIIANQLAMIVDLVFDNNLPNLGTSLMWITIFCYTFQIYFDFSGYSDMAIGLGRIFGFHFLENFNYPLTAKSITDFWHRWHISLSSWFKDYVYIPLGGNRVSTIKWVRNILIVWLLTGLWHGASWNFVIWGLYFGILLIIEKLFLQKWLKKVPVFIAWAYTLVIVTISFLIFRANNFSQLSNFARLLICYQPTNWLLFLQDHLMVFKNIIIILPAFILAFPIYKYTNDKYQNSLIYTLLEDVIIFGLFIICIAILTNNGYNPFIYFRF